MDSRETLALAESPEHLLRQKGPGVSTGAALLSSGQRLGRLLVVVVLDLFKVGIDDVIVIFIRRAIGLCFGFSLAGLVHGFTQLHRGFGKSRGLFLDGFGIVAIQHALEIGKGGFDRRLVLGRNLVAIVLEGLFSRMNQRFALIAGFNRLALALVRFGIGLGILDHLFNVGVG